MNAANTSQDQLISGYRWLAKNPGKFGGKPIVLGTRFSVSFILSCLSEGMTHQEIVQEYSTFPAESIPEILKFASTLTDNPDVAA